MVADSESKRKWDKENTKHYGFKMFRSTDADLIEALDNSGNVNGFIRQALREKVERDKSQK